MRESEISEKKLPDGQGKPAVTFHHTATVPFPASAADLENTFILNYQKLQLALLPLTGIEYFVTGLSVAGMEGLRVKKISMPVPGINPDSSQAKS